MKTAAVYVRVSTDMQTEYSPDSQIKLIKEYARNNKYHILNEFIFMDEGISGRNAENRPAFQAMITTAKQKQFDVILIYSSSRFARNLEDSIVYRSMLERECGVEVISITQPFVDKKTDMLTNAIYAVMDEWYSMDLSQNVKRGMTEKASRGEIQGFAPFGYKITESKKPPIIVDDEADIVKDIFSLFINQKKSYLNIARELNKRGLFTRAKNQWTRKRVEYILNNPFYAGKICWNKREQSKKIKPKSEWIISDGLHEPIISSEFFEKVQNIIATSKVKKYDKPFNFQKHWLSGILKCHYCGKTLVRNNNIINGRKYYYYRCSGFLKGICKRNNSIGEQEAIDLLFASIKKTISGVEQVPYEHIKRRNNDSELMLSQLKIQLEKVGKRLIRAKEAYLNEIDTMEEYNEVKTSCNKERKLILQKIKDVEDNSITQKNIDSLLLRLDSTIVTLANEDMSYEEKNTLIKSIVEYVKWDRYAPSYEVFYLI